MQTQNRFFRHLAAACLATAALVGPAAAAETVPEGAANGFKVLASFQPGQGWDARAPMTLGADGNFYGVAVYGGRFNMGSLYRVTPAGRLTVLHHFRGNASEGGFPIGALIQNADGSFLGTTCEGGPYAGGGVYRASREGKIQMIRWFNEDGTADAPGCSHAPLLRGRDGLLYGTTISGGAYGEGTVFSMAEDGSAFRVVHSFRGGAQDGAGPTAGLIQASDGAFYGTTTRGGRFDLGSVYRISADGKQRTVHFMEQAGGSAPWGPLVEASDGALYGVNQSYGPDPFDSESGTAFRISPKGNYRVVSDFGTDGDDPRWSSAGLIQARDGSLWGTSSWGGAYFYGAIFRIDPDGTMTTRHSFFDINGSSPAGGLVYGTDGRLYGTTSTGGEHSLGVIYRIDPN